MTYKFKFWQTYFYFQKKKKNCWNPHYFRTEEVGLSFEYAYSSSLIQMEQKKQGIHSMHIHID